MKTRVRLRKERKLAKLIKLGGGNDMDLHNLTERQEAQVCCLTTHLAFNQIFHKTNKLPF